MIGLRALILCESVRVETDGTLTIIGMYNERLLAPAGDGPLEIRGLTVLAVISGLAGCDEIAVRHSIRHAEDRRAQPEIPMLHERHDPRFDEHNVVFAHGPMAMVAGPHDLVVELGGREHRYRFHVVRRS